VSARADAGDDTVGLLQGRWDGAWRDFAVPGEPLVVSVPGQPDENRWTAKGRFGEVPESDWLLVQPGGAVSLSVNVARFPPDMRPSAAEVPAVLPKIADHCTALLPREIKSRTSKPLDLGDVPGVQVIYDTHAGLGLLVRAFLRGDRAYCLVTSARHDADLAVVERFIRSARWADAVDAGP
jgi:hypothetical protein